MRILVVEDEERVADILLRGLRAERFAVDVALNGERADSLLRTVDYDMVILDLMLPDVSGTELLRRTRSYKPGVPVLILTARDDVLDKVEHLNLGADDYLTKPFAFAELLARLKALLRRGATIQGTVLKAADLELDRAAQQVRRGGKKIALTGKEFSLLDYLLTNKGKALSRTMIMERVWDESFSGLTNIVDVYIRYLRAKIDDGQSLKLIRTVRGVGYCVSEEAE